MNVMLLYFTLSIKTKKSGYSVYRRVWLDDRVIQERFMLTIQSRFTQVEPNIWGAFQAVEFEFDMRTEPYRFLFNEERLRQSARQPAESCGRSTSPLVNYRVGRATPDLSESTGQSKMTWWKWMYLSLVPCRDIVPCQKTEKWNYREIHRITSKNRWVSEFFI
jgi:hypothetical protein